MQLHKEYFSHYDDDECLSFSEKELNKEVKEDLIYLFDNLFHEVESVYENPMSLSTYRIAYDLRDKALIAANKGNCKEFHLAKSFALKAGRDCYAEIEKYEMAAKMHDMDIVFCEKYGLNK